MNADQIQTACANAMGWTVENEYWTHPEFSERINLVAGCAPDFIANANHSLKLIAHLAGEGWMPEIHCAQGEWTCVFERHMFTRDNGSVIYCVSENAKTVDGWHYHRAPTFQEAVVGAFLKVLGRWKEGE